jgi:hypothetical protein
VWTVPFFIGVSGLAASLQLSAVSHQPSAQPWDGLAFVIFNGFDFAVPLADCLDL